MARTKNYRGNCLNGSEPTHWANAFFSTSGDLQKEFVKYKRIFADLLTAVDAKCSKAFSFRGFAQLTPTRCSSPGFHWGSAPYPHYSLGLPCSPCAPFSPFYPATRQMVVATWRHRCIITWPILYTQSCAYNTCIAFYTTFDFIRYT